MHPNSNEKSARLKRRGDFLVRNLDSILFNYDILKSHQLSDRQKATEDGGWGCKLEKLKKGSCAEVT